MSTYEEVAFIGGYDMQCTNKFTSTPNWCNQTPAKDSSGNALGEVVWVGTDCNSGGLLPMDEQQPIYQMPGVSTGSVPASAKLKA